VKTGAEYIEDIRKIEPCVYILGEKVKNVVDHPIVRPTLNATAYTFDIAQDPKYAGLATATSSLTGDRVNRFNHLLLSQEDLYNRVEFMRVWQNQVAACAVRCTGSAAINGLYASTYDVDKKRGTEYHKRFVEFLRNVQKKDLFVCSGMIDVKGNRSLGPSEQVDPDLFLRVVERRKDGVVVRGAKAHQTGAALSHEILVVPSRVLTEKDKDYAIAFAIPNGTKGLIYIFQHSLLDSRALVAKDIDLGNTKYSSSFGGTALMVFDDVFIPNERIFLNGEVESSQTIMRNFASLARMWEGGCRPGVMDVLIGAGMAIAEYNGIPKASHVMEKLTEISFLAEAIFGSAVAGCKYCWVSPAGVHFPDPKLVSVSKLQAIHNFYEALKLILDIAGGLAMTMPSERDFRSPEVGKYVEKYLKGAEPFPTEHRIRMFRLIETLAAGPDSCALHHGGGPMEAQRITIRQRSITEEKKKLATALIGLDRK
jgi:4-hydroxybutyryl-CoA dehydratase/vinylacetyl-CoA-Delta-isomerase